VSKYVLSSGAVADLKEIWEFIAQDSPEAADRWIERLFEAFESLGKVPGMGHRREDLAVFPVLFFVTQVEVEIVALTQGSRDIPAFLRLRVSK
jgi:plasmid stabilization system protein ParE